MTCVFVFLRCRDRRLVVSLYSIPLCLSYHIWALSGIMRAGAVLQHASRGFMQMMGNGLTLRVSTFYVVVTIKSSC